MSTFLGVILIGIFIVCVIGFAAAVTWLVVKLTPTRRPKSSPEGS